MKPLTVAQQLANAKTNALLDAKIIEDLRTQLKAARDSKQFQGIAYRKREAELRAQLHGDAPKAQRVDRGAIAKVLCAERNVRSVSAAEIDEYLVAHS